VNVAKKSRQLSVIASRLQWPQNPLVVQVFREAGVPASLSRYVYVLLNGDFLGLYALVEQVDSTFLKRNHIPLDASLWKSSAGQTSNLRWDLPKDQVQWAYSKATRKVCIGLASVSANSFEFVQSCRRSNAFFYGVL
jgi:spore coat protein CotH